MFRLTFFPRPFRLGSITAFVYLSMGLYAIHLTRSILSRVWVDLLTAILCSEESAGKVLGIAPPFTCLPVDLQKFIRVRFRTRSPTLRISEVRFRTRALWWFGFHDVRCIGCRVVVNSELFMFIFWPGLPFTRLTDPFLSNLGQTNERKSYLVQQSSEGLGLGLHRFKSRRQTCVG
ncbi:hypothetical protein DFH06DRAFT_976 [Mycena polygramma]|nr:hypothetical protein DFH06DRAFT_976 [Mycena polygramma]